MNIVVHERLQFQTGRPKLSLVPKPKTDLELIVEESERDFAEIRSLMRVARSEMKIAIFLAFLNVLGVYAVVARTYGFI